MRIYFKFLTLAFIGSVITFSVKAIDTSKEEAVCLEIGFKPKTEAFGNCVLELVSRKNKTNQQAKASPALSAASNPSKQVQTSNPKGNPDKKSPEIVGDGSQDDRTCQAYGFKPGAANYAECRQKIDLARQEGQRQQAQFEAQQRQYEAQMAEYKRQRERAASLALMQMGLGMMAGGSPATNFAPPPVAPIAPHNQTQTYFLPNGKAMSCTTTGSVTNCF